MAGLSFAALEFGRDRAAVRNLMDRAADYVRLEQGKAPDSASVADYFFTAVPGATPEQMLRIGVFEDGRLVGISDLGFGYPQAADAYIGLVMLDAACRGRGIGRAVVAHLAGLARERGALRLLVAVLEANAAGRAFWAAQGFELEQVFPASASDPLGHVRLRLTRDLL